MPVDLEHDLDEDDCCTNCGMFPRHVGPVCLFKLGVLVGRAQVDPQARSDYEALLERVKNSWQDDTTTWNPEDIEKELSTPQGLIYGMTRKSP